MKKTILGIGLSLMMSGTAMAENIGVSMALFDDNFLTVLRNGMTEYAGTLDNVTLQVDRRKHEPN